MTSAIEQAILKCSRVERDLDIMYCRSLRNDELPGEMAICVKSIRKRKRNE